RVLFGSIAGDERLIQALRQATDRISTFLGARS
ncbi:MAG: hypothetical protein RLZZ422_1900, partial [Pseudomonadota bacterium]